MSSERGKPVKRIATLRTELGKRATSSTPLPLTDKERENIDELPTAVSTADETWNNALISDLAIKVLAEASDCGGLPPL